MKLNIKADCGNSPKKKLIKNLTVWFASYAIQEVLPYLDRDVKWILEGDVPIVGKERFAAALGQMSQNKAAKLNIYSILTHGKEAAVNGEMVMEDGAIYAFADFYEFNSAKSIRVKSITSYVIQKTITSSGGYPT